MVFWGKLFDKVPDFSRLKMVIWAKGATDRGEEECGNIL